MLPSMIKMASPETLSLELPDKVADGKRTVPVTVWVSELQRLRAPLLGGTGV